MAAVHLTIILCHLNIVYHANMDKVCRSFLTTKLDLFKALSSYNSVRNHVFHAQRIVV